MNLLRDLLRNSVRIKLLHGDELNLTVKTRSEREHPVLHPQ
jgi:hypothetical protein